MSVAAYQRVQTALRKWVELAVVGTDAEDKVIFGQQGKPRPDRPYAGITIDSIQSRGRDERRDLDAGGVREIVGPRVVIATIQTYGTGAIGLAEQVRSYLWREDVINLIRLEGVSFLAAESVQNITTVLDSDFEERGAFEARFAYAARQDETVGFFEDVHVTGEYLDATGSPAEDVDFWVPESPA